MIPEAMKSMFGLKDEKDIKMANNIWKMLDEMSSNDPEVYKKFIEKNLNEGVTDAKAEKQKKEKPFKITPKEYVLLQMDAKLEEKVIGAEESERMSMMREKLDMNIDKEKWSVVKAKFPEKIRIHLNLCHHQRVKNPTSKVNGGQEIKDFHLAFLKDIQELFYSLQGPEVKQQDYYYTMIFSSNFVKAFDTAPNGKKLFMSLAVTYFQERIQADRNVILTRIDTLRLYGKNLYYGIDKLTIQVSTDKKYRFGTSNKPGQFLLEPEVDNNKQRQQSLKQKSQRIQKKQKVIADAGIKTKESVEPVKKNELIIKTKVEEVSKTQDKQLPPLVTAPQKKSNKVLIEVLDEKDATEQQNNEKFPYQMKETQEGYSFEFLVHGITKISELDLQVSSQMIKLAAKNRKAEVKLNKKINEDNVKAKMKKKSHVLLVDVKFK